LYEGLLEKFPGIGRDHFNEMVTGHVAEKTHMTNFFDDFYDQYMGAVGEEIACAIQELINEYKPPKTPEELMCEYVTKVMEGIDLGDYVIPAEYDRETVSEIVGERLAFMDDELLHLLVGQDIAFNTDHNEVYLAISGYLKELNWEDY
jgi:hypothetical protein